MVVGVGGATGSCLRYLISYFSQKVWGASFPWWTLLVNVIGCLIMGLLMGYSSRNITLTQYSKLLLITGFCGGFTTFSAFAFENFVYIDQGRFLNAVFYIFISVILGTVAVYLGYLGSKA